MQGHSVAPAAIKTSVRCIGIRIKTLYLVGLVDKDVRRRYCRSRVVVRTKGRTVAERVPVSRKPLAEQIEIGERCDQIRFGSRRFDDDGASECAVPARGGDQRTCLRIERLFAMLRR